VHNNPTTATDSTGRGPSQRVVAWRQFVFETALAIVLVIAAIEAATHLSGLFAVAGLVTVVGLALAIVRHHERPG
jgi:hypothetical protein